jgi:acetylglutamate kinase
MIVIKYGGHALPTPGSRDPIMQLLAERFISGTSLVLVHGGGPHIDAELSLHGIAREMVAGYRKTTPEVFAVVQKVLSGDVLRTLVNQFVSFGVNAVGLSAGDGELIRVNKMLPLVDGTEVDIGLVGDIDEVNPKILIELMSNGFLPVISPVAVDKSGQGFNVNADIAAGAIAGALMADEIIFMTDVAGIYRSYPDPDSLITSITADNLRALQPTFAEGMAPKVKAALSALAEGAKKVRIIDGRDVQNVRDALNGQGGTVVEP